MKGKKKSTFALDESGAVVTVAAITLAAICGFVALAFDIGHMVMVKTELQRTADSAALAGAMGLAPYLDPTTPYWQGGVNKAKTMVIDPSNEADGQTATLVGEPVTGYWMIYPLPGYEQLSKVKPASASVPEPAVKVTLSQNVTLYFAPVIGISGPATVTATATAILPEGYTITGAPPIAVTHDTVFNPNPDGSWTLDATPTNIQPQSNKGIAGWFNFDTITNQNQSVPSVRDMQSTEVTAGETQIHFVPGSKATLMDYVSEGQTVILPYVNDADLSQGNNTTVQGFSAFKITSLSANSMTGYFVPYTYSPNVKIRIPGGSPPSPISGTPRIVSPY